MKKTGSNCSAVHFVQSSRQDGRSSGGRTRFLSVHEIGRLGGSQPSFPRPVASRWLFTAERQVFGTRDRPLRTQPAPLRRLSGGCPMSLRNQSKRQNDMKPPNKITGANAGQRLGFAGKSRVGLSPPPGVA